MIFKYSTVRSIGVLKNKNSCYVINVTSFFKNGSGKIFYRNFLDLTIIKAIKFVIFYFNINLNSYDFYLNIEPNNFKKFDNCLDLSIFFSIFFSFFKINIKKNIIVIGGINFKDGKIIKVGKIFHKLNFLTINNFYKLAIIPEVDKIIYKTINLSILKFKYLYEIYYFFKRCLTQRKSNAITRRLSGVRFSQHL